MMRLAPCIAILLLAAAAAGSETYTDGTGMLGVLIRPVPLSVLEDVGLEPGQGTLVRRVWPGTAADQMGLQPGDVVVAINGSPINSRRDLREATWSQNPGDAARITVLRAGGEAVQLDGAFGRMPGWLERRIRLPSERWDDFVAARQRAILAARAAALDALEQAVAAVEAHRRSVADGLPPLRFDGVAGAESAPLGLLAAARPWGFHYRWSYAALDPTREF